MNAPHLVILYVGDIARALAFWSDLLGVAPIERHDTFALVPLRPDFTLGLWLAPDVAPPVTVRGGGTELCIALDARPDVDATHADWLARGIAVIQPPTEMDFGYTFTATDPDGHRIRVYRPNEA